MGILLRNATPADVPAILRLEEACYPTLALVAHWNAALLANHQRRFPEGQFVAEHQGEVVGHSACFVTRSELVLRPHTFGEATARGTFDTHDPHGDTLYGAEIMVHPDHRRLGVGKRFYEARLALAGRLGLRYFVAGGRIPGYLELAGRLTPEEYVRQVVAGEREDRVLTPQLRSGLRVAEVMSGYLNDPNSGGYATLLVWENPRAVSARRPSSSAPAAARRKNPSPG